MREYEARQALNLRQTRRRVRDNWVGIAGGLAVVVVAVLGVWAYSAWGPGAAPSEPPASPEATSTPAAGDELELPSPDLAEGRTWTGALTVGGVELGVELDGALAPQATAMFVQAAETGWYDGTFCPRVTAYETMQVLQCGTRTPDSTASEDGYRFGPIENAPADDRYPAGTIAMARVGGDGASMSHQFFIVTADSTIPSDAAGGYSVVGRVTSGLDRLIEQVTSLGTRDGGEDGVPAVPVEITAFTIQ